MSLVLRRARAVALAAVAVALLPRVAVAQTAPTARQIHEKYVDAVGGRAAWQAITSMATKASVESPAMGKLTTEVLMARPGRMVSTVVAPFGEIRTGFDGEVAWGINPMQGPTILSGPEADALRQTGNWGAMTYEPGSFTSATVVGAADFDGKKSWQVKLVPLVGPEMDEYFDQATGLKIGVVAKLPTQMGEVEVRTIMQEYMTQGAVRLPRVTVQSNQMMGDLTITVESVVFNTVPASAFALPDAVKALRK